MTKKQAKSTTQRNSSNQAADKSSIYGGFPGSAQPKSKKVTKHRRSKSGTGKQIKVKKKNRDSSRGLSSL